MATGVGTGHRTDARDSVVDRLACVEARLASTSFAESVATFRGLDIWRRFSSVEGILARAEADPVGRLWVRALAARFLGRLTPDEEAEFAKVLDSEPEPSSAVLARIFK